MCSLKSRKIYCSLQSRVQDWKIDEQTPLGLYHLLVLQRIPAEAEAEAEAETLCRAQASVGLEVLPVGSR